MTKEQLDSALSAGKIDVASYFDVIDQLTGKGTAAQKAAEDALKTTGGQMKSMISEWDSLLRNFGQLLNEGLIVKFLPELQEAAGFFRDLMRDRTEDLIADTPSSFTKWAEEHGYAEPKQRTREEIEAEAARRAEAQKNTEQYKSLRLAALADEGAARWDNMSTAERRASIARTTGLGENVSVATLDEKIRQHEAVNKVAAESVTGEDLAELQKLKHARERLKLVEKEEELSRKQAATQEQYLRNVEQDREMMKARIAGDSERVRLLELAAETERLAAQYRTQGGLSPEEALQQAAQDIELREQAKAAERQRSATSAGTSSLVRSTGWLSTAMADIGGGGSRIRTYEASTVKVAQNTEKNTANIAGIAGKILDFLNNNTLTASPVLA